MTPSRRATLQWMMAAAALPLARWATPAASAEAATAPSLPMVADWPASVPAPPAVAGYGRDPDLQTPKVVWPLTFDPAQRATVDLLGDMILPADAVSPGAGKLGVGAFVDEWISAPYPIQRGDREAVLAGLTWLDAQSRAMHRKPFAALAPAQRAGLMDALTVATPAPAMAKPVAFMDTLRYLFVLGFYSLPEGKADMGYIGDQPTEGEYPGPTPEALAHYAKLVDRLGIKAA
jgi:hypothetical protein